MKRTETLIREIINNELELRNRDALEICKAIEKVEKKMNEHSSCCTQMLYEGARDDLIIIDRDGNTIDLYEEDKK